MKEATGELSSSVVIVISVGVLLMFVVFSLYPIVKNNFRQQTSCEKAKCSTVPDSNGMVECKDGNYTIKCKYKG